MRHFRNEYQFDFKLNMKPNKNTDLSHKKHPPKMVHKQIHTTKTPDTPSILIARRAAYARPVHYYQLQSSLNICTCVKYC